MKMRIVGMNNRGVFVQVENGNKWNQIFMENNGFLQMMENDFPKYVKEYKSSKKDTDIISWLYHYGENHRMIAKGQAFIFNK